MDKQGIEYEVKDLTQETDKLEMFRDKGFLQAPIVVTDGQEWFGFRPDLIQALAADAGKMEVAAAAA